ncbi:MAG TPA: ABC transporter permease [Gemmatimonadaceae bacterium]|nr:ABC transporter permease [Gemmatimonadaceae bacterium]
MIEAPGRARAGVRTALGAPAFVVLILLAAALSSLAVASFAGSPWFGHYRKFLGDDLFLAYLLRSFRVAAWTTLVAIVVGYAIAYTMTQVSATMRRLIVMLLVLQFFSVSVTRIYSIILLLGNNGAVNRSLLALGVVDAPVRLIYNELGVIIGLINASLPFAVFPIYSVLERVPPSLREAAYTLGARRARSFWQVVFPLSIPGMAASVVIVFLYSLGAFATPLLLGGGFVDLISVFAYEQAINLSNYGFAAAGAIVTTVLGLVLVYAFTALVERRVSI